MLLNLKHRSPETLILAQNRRNKGRNRKNISPKIKHELAGQMAVGSAVILRRAPMKHNGTKGGRCKEGKEKKIKEKEKKKKERKRKEKMNE